MATIPETSISLIRSLSAGADNDRWLEFFKRYEEPMRAFLNEDRFRGVEADDVIQEVLMSLSTALPRFLVTEDRKGHFRNFLMGIVKHKALDMIRKSARDQKLKGGFKEEGGVFRNDREYKEWQFSLMEVALEQLLNDDSINSRTREVFRHLVEYHEKPEQVAEMFALTRNNVDQIKKRMIEKLAKIISLMDV